MTTRHNRDVKPESVRIEIITRSDNTRAKTSQSTIDAYAAAMMAGERFPPIDVFRDVEGGMWLGDGHHRCAAALALGTNEILAKVRDGGRIEALLHSAQSNGAHGLRRTNADKRHAVELVLHVAADRSDLEISKICGVSDKTVAAVRRRAGSENPNRRRTSKKRARSVNVGALCFALVRRLKGQPAAAIRDAIEAALAKRKPADELAATVGR